MWKYAEALCVAPVLEGALHSTVRLCEEETAKKKKIRILLSLDRHRHRHRFIGHAK